MQPSSFFTRPRRPPPPTPPPPPPSLLFLSLLLLAHCLFLAHPTADAFLVLPSPSTTTTTIIIPRAKIRTPLPLPTPLHALPPHHQHTHTPSTITTTTPLPSPVTEWTTGGFPSSKHALFLAEYWQKRPLLIRKAFDPAQTVVGPSELLALACDDLVTSRLIEKREEEEDEDGDDEGRGNSGWTVRQGPFDEEDFEMEEGKRKWTVLVQEVDRHVPEVADLLQAFRFVPNWRIDDIMISYAPQAGGIGPHVDNYDVFLLQGQGTRKWAIQNLLLSAQDEKNSLIPNSPVRILSSFQEDHAWILEPGDMLYLPPRVPHNGVSLDGEGMTYSIGFRAPTQKELVQAVVEAVVGEEGERGRGGGAAAEGVFFSDDVDDLQRQSVAGDGDGGGDPGEITSAALAQLKGLILSAVMPALEDEEVLARWMGKCLTTPKRKRLDEDYPPRMSKEEAEEMVQMLLEGSSELRVYRAEGIKFAHAHDYRFLFVDGQFFELTDSDRERRRRICLCLTDGGGEGINAKLLEEEKEQGGNSEFVDLVRRWLEQGFLYILEEEEEGE